MVNRGAGGSETGRMDKTVSSGGDAAPEQRNNKQINRSFRAGQKNLLAALQRSAKMANRVGQLLEPLLPVSPMDFPAYTLLRVEMESRLQFGAALTLLLNTLGKHMEQTPTSACFWKRPLILLGSVERPTLRWRSITFMPSHMRRTRLVAGAAI